MKINIELWVYRVLGLAFVVYLILRAKLIPMTVDEVSTCLSHVPRSLLDIVFYQNDPVPNNHVLNTLGIKILSWFFGMYHVTARVPALVGGVLFLTAAVAFTQWNNRWWMRAFTFVILLCNPFVVEFFALARGYGLAVGIMLLAVWQAVAYLKAPKPQRIINAALLAFLAVEANFTLLNWFVPFVFFLLILVYQQEKSAFLRSAWPIFSAILLTGGFAYWPITRMRATDQFQFWGSSSFFKDTMVPLLKSSTHRHPYLGADTVEIFAWMIIAFSLVVWALALLRWVKNKGQLDAIVLLSGIYAGTILFNFAQGILFKTPFLDARTSIFLYPLLALQLIATANWLQSKWNYWALCLVIPIGLFGIANFNNNRNLNSTTEWWFDKGTFAVLEYMKETYEAEGKHTPYSIDSYWVNYNSLDFHTKHSTPHYDKYALLPDWHPRRTFPEDTEFYYTEERAEIDAIITRYDIVLRIPESGLVLLRKKRDAVPPNQ